MKKYSGSLIQVTVLALHYGKLGRAMLVICERKNIKYKTNLYT